jgi:serine/threonine protein kinase
MACNEPTSGFVKPDNVILTAQFTDFSTVPSSGYSLLVRAKRHGRWWMLKGLKEPYRQDAIYQVLLQKEYEITCQLQHPMVVSAFSFEEVDGLGPCIVMEWIEGLTLKEWLTQGKHTMKQRRHVADMLMEALAYVHSRQTQHRDLKPSNIMLTHDGQHLKLIDFGLSDTDSHTILKASAGTEGYMAPDGPSDIYSLGCILRELHVGWWANQVIRKCVAPLNHRYSTVASIQKVLHRCWQWPRRITVTICLLALFISVYLFGISHTQSLHQTEMQVLNDSLMLIKQKNDANATTIHSTQTTIDSLQSRINEMEVDRQKERVVIQDRQDYIQTAKREIDQKIRAYGIQQMFDTVSCQKNVTIPFMRITLELEKQYEEPELKQYIKERYRDPWMKRLSELPFR